MNLECKHRNYPTPPNRPSFDCDPLLERYTAATFGKMEKMAESFVAASELQLEHTLEDFDIATQQLLAQGSQCLQRRKLVSFQTDEMCKFCFVLKTIVCACVCVCVTLDYLV